MGTKKKKQSVVLLLLLLAVILMTIGFAAYARTLNINGNVTVKGSPWNVLYNNAYSGDGVSTTNGSATATQEVINTNDTNFAFTVTLEKPGDFYEATIAPHNFGTLDAKLTSVTMGDISTHSNYLSYSITYDGTTYTSTTTGITGSTLAAGAEKTAVVRVEYLQPASANDLPASDVTVTVTGALGYESVE